MKVGILILVRLGSTRLKNKHLIEVQGVAYLNYIINRFHNFFKDFDFQIIIATSNKSENRLIETVIDLDKANVFYGSDRNIPLRQYECALKYGLTHIISLDGDDIFCSTNAAYEVYAKLKNGVKGAKTVGLPIGLNIMGYDVGLLEQSMINDKKLNCEIFETGWGRIFDNKLDTIYIEIANKEYLDILRFTLDYPEDSLFFRNLIEKYPGSIIEANDDEIIDFVIKNNLFLINNHLKEIYETNFNNQKLTEIVNNEK
jgi:spore coat polysaccharide biosynthesis protein SpsF